MRIVVDTNVIASAIFFGGKPYQLLHYIMEGRVDVVASKEIVDEYEEIVLRLKQKYPRIDTRIPLQKLLSKFEIIRVSSDIQASRDPDDDKFISCAVDGKFFSTHSIRLPLSAFFPWELTEGGPQKMRCANMQGMFRILQSIPSKKAERFVPFFFGVNRCLPIGDWPGLICM